MRPLPRLESGQISCAILGYFIVSATLNQKPGHLHKVGAALELLDGNSAVAQNPLYAVDEGNGIRAAPRIPVARLQGNESGSIPATQRERIAWSLG